MAIRKEQILALLTLGLGVLIGRQYLEEPASTRSVNPGKIKFEATKVVSTPLVTTAAAGMARRDFCTEPSETRPLPPRELAFPPRAPLSVVSLPLEPGPDYGHLSLLHQDGAQIEGVVLQQAGEAAAAATPAEEPAAQGGTRKEREERAARTYDRIWVGGLAAASFGTIEVPEGVDLFKLEESKDFDGVELRLRSYNVDTGKVGAVIVYGRAGDKVKIDRIALADTLRNEINRRVRKIPEDPSYLAERRELIQWLLEKAREVSWVYDEALQHADLYVKLAAGDVEALRLRQKVLRARGDLGGELAMLDGLTGQYRESAFRYEGLGLLKARLALYEDAEQDLRHAAKLAPNDARPQATLAEFLRQRGRSDEALLAARAAEQALGSLQDDRDRARVVGTLVACHLAVGNLQAARNALRLVPADQPQPYLEGCVQYAAGQTEAALALFRQTGAAADRPPGESGAALLGQAACLLRSGQWQEAHDLLVRVADQEPLLRHRAATGLALLFSRTNQFDQALAWIDRALEAAPQDPYAFYLRGRTLRLQGQLAGAEEALRSALRTRDDFVHAIAEMAAVQFARARDGSGSEQAQAALAAKSYGDRAVDLAPVPSVELFELQGIYRFGAADGRGAAAAFVKARELAGSESDKLFAKGALTVVDYSRNLVDDAATALGRLVQDLGKDEPIRKWAEATLVAIEDHAQKETLEDSFDRAEVGTIWTVDRDGATGAMIVDGRLTFDGALKTGTEVFANRLGAVPKGKNFLAVGVVMQLGKKQSHNDGFAGLRIELQRDFKVQLGIREGKPYLRIEDGRDEGKESGFSGNLELAGFDVDGRQDLELRVVPRGDGQVQNRTFALVVSWNGVEVHRRDLKTLTASTATELKTVLFAGGSKGGSVDVHFDDYRLERRKDTSR